MTTSHPLAGRCGVSGCPDAACGASVTFAAPHPLDNVLTEFTVPICERHQRALVEPIIGAAHDHRPE